MDLINNVNQLKLNEIREKRLMMLDLLKRLKPTTYLQINKILIFLNLSIYKW
jgi:hypothetical protein